MESSDDFGTVRSLDFKNMAWLNAIKEVQNRTDLSETNLEDADDFHY